MKPPGPFLVGRHHRTAQPDAVTAAAITEFAAAVKDSSGSVPPTFAFVPATIAMREFFSHNDVDPALAQVLHIEQTFIHHRPIEQGDLLHADVYVDSYRESAVDSMHTRTELSDEAGEPVATLVMVLVRADLGTLRQ